MKREIPEHVSWRVRDAWLCMPPCTLFVEPYCHVDCPYFTECNPPEEEDEDSVKWDQSYEELTK